MPKTSWQEGNLANCFQPLLADMKNEVSLCLQSGEAQREIKETTVPLPGKCSGQLLSTPFKKMGKFSFRGSLNKATARWRQE